MDTLKNEKVWLITGTSKGLGLQLTKLLLSLGHKVVATSRDVAPLEEQISTNKENFYPIALDITSDQDVKEKIESAIYRFGRIDVVVNNAGYSLVGSMEEMTDQEFRSSMDVNLFGAVCESFRCSKCNSACNALSAQARLRPYY
jgi:NAD(P)-dependent dehydrogenase (short-subunit alcohol dehydrogenase family)